jgi:hypothetical protein
VPILVAALLGAAAAPIEVERSIERGDVRGEA